MNLKLDGRHYWLKGLLRQAKTFTFDIDPDPILTQRYRKPGWEQDEVKVLTKNQIIDIAVEYIAELEAEVEKLQYVARIIDLAKGEPR